MKSDASKIERLVRAKMPAKSVFIGDLFLLRLLCATPLNSDAGNILSTIKINNCRMLYRLVAVNENPVERNDRAPCSKCFVWGRVRSAHESIGCIY